MDRGMVVAIAFLVGSTALANEIPLDTIWAFDMPGTRDVAGIPLPEVDQRKRPGQDHEMYRNQRANYIEMMRQQLTAKPSSVEAMQGFVIPRQVDLHTLQQASSRLQFNKKLGLSYPLGRMPAGEYPVSEEDVTLVFFSYPAAYHLRLTKVERNGESITVRYRYQPHWSAESTVHFALIPLGRLPAGQYKVEFEQERMEQKYQDAGFLRVWQERKLVALPFSFTIFEPPSPALAEPDKDAVQIPLKEIWTDGMPGTRDLGELEPRAADDRHSAGPILQEIRTTLMAYQHKLGDQAKKGFALNGLSLATLKQAKEVLAGERGRAETLEAGDVTLVFYAHRRGPSVCVDAVERKDRLFTIKWHFVLHESGNSRASIALIPAGKLAAGAYEVRLVQLPATVRGATEGARPYSPGFVRQIVCQPFTFQCDVPGLKAP